MAELTPEQRVLRAKLAAHSMHAQGKTNTKAARRAWEQKFIDQVDPDRVLPLEERMRRAASAKSAHMARLALRSSRSRSERRTA